MERTFPDAEGHGDDAVGAGDSVQTADEVRQVVQHAQVVLHHDDVPVADKREKVLMMSIFLIPPYRVQTAVCTILIQP